MKSGRERGLYSPLWIVSTVGTLFATWNDNAEENSASVIGPRVAVK